MECTGNPGDAENLGQAILGLILTGRGFALRSLGDAGRGSFVRRQLNWAADKRTGEMRCALAVSASAERVLGLARNRLARILGADEVYMDRCEAVPARDDTTLLEVALRKTGGLSVIDRLRLRQALANFKALVETGEIATTAGQPTGRRSSTGEVFLTLSRILRQSAPFWSWTPPADEGETPREDPPGRPAEAWPGHTETDP